MTGWQTIDTAPETGEFLAYDPVSKKQDVCERDWRGNIWQVQMDGELGPYEHEFQGPRASHWMPLPECPAP